MSNKQHLWLEGRKIVDVEYTKERVKEYLPVACTIAFWYAGEDDEHQHVWCKINGPLADLDTLRSCSYLRLLDLQPMAKQS